MIILFDEIYKYKPTTQDENYKPTTHEPRKLQANSTEENNANTP